MSKATEKYKIETKVNSNNNALRHVKVDPAVGINVPMYNLQARGCGASALH